MTLVASSVTIHFPPDYDEQSEYETPFRGYLSEVVVETADGSRYGVFFFDPVRLGQELELHVRLGRPYVAEPGMIVLPEVTTEAIRDTVEKLDRAGYFNSLKPL
jgi:hypothetical protein